MRGAVHHLEPALGPSPHELVGMHLRTAGVGIVEIAPSEHVDASDAAPLQVIDVPVEIPVGMRLVGETSESRCLLALQEDDEWISARDVHDPVRGVEQFERLVAAPHHEPFGLAAVGDPALAESRACIAPSSRYSMPR